METLLTNILIVFGILQIILFFKLWGMTNNMKQVRDLLLKADRRVTLSKNPNLPGWADGVTEDEKLEVLDLVLKCSPNSVIIKYISSNTYSNWSLEYWETAGKNDKKLIYVNKN